MKITEAYVAALWFLEELVERKLIGVNPPTENLDVTCILSSMDPFMWSPDETGVYRPIDQTKGGDWKDAITLAGGNIKGDISSEQAFLGMIAYIEFYKNEFKFCVQETIDLLNHMKLNPEKYKELWELWEHYIDRYKKYSPDYPVDIDGEGGAYEADESGSLYEIDKEGNKYTRKAHGLPMKGSAE